VRILSGRILTNYASLSRLSLKQKVKAGRIAAVIVGLIAIILGILFKNQNVNFLVGLAFAIAASANLPAILMLLFRKKTTSSGTSWAIVIGTLTSLGIILLSPTLYEIYGLNPQDAPIPLQNPGVISIPLGFIALIAVSLLTQKKKASKPV
jgi:cation/acetate symporter